MSVLRLQFLPNDRSSLDSDSDLVIISCAVKRENSVGNTPPFQAKLIEFTGGLELDSLSVARTDRRLAFNQVRF